MMIVCKMMRAGFIPFVEVQEIIQLFSTDPKKHLNYGNMPYVFCQMVVGKEIPQEEVARLIRKGLARRHKQKHRTYCV
jgi:hypothetical protein